MMLSIGYDPARRILEIEFQSGDVYQYIDVPQGVHRALQAASSKGRYFHATIDGAYEHVRASPGRRRRKL
jgi:hypothetical protein